MVDSASYKTVSNSDEGLYIPVSGHTLNHHNSISIFIDDLYWPVVLSDEPLSPMLKPNQQPTKYKIYVQWVSLNELDTCSFFSQRPIQFRCLSFHIFVSLISMNYFLVSLCCFLYRWCSTWLRIPPGIFSNGRRLSESYTSTDIRSTLCLRVCVACNNK